MQSCALNERVSSSIYVKFWCSLKPVWANQCSLTKKNVWNLFQSHDYQEFIQIINDLVRNQRRTLYDQWSWYYVNKLCPIFIFFRIAVTTFKILFIKNFKNVIIGLACHHKALVMFFYYQVTEERANELANCKHKVMPWSVKYFKLTNSFQPFKFISCITGVFRKRDDWQPLKGVAISRHRYR